MEVGDLVSLFSVSLCRVVRVHSCGTCEGKRVAKMGGG